MHTGQVVSQSLCPQTAPNRRAAQEERANKWTVLALSGTAAFMTTLDTSIVNISLPAIAREFNVPLSGSVEWIVIGYLVVIAATLLTFGRLADDVGRKPLFMGGLVVFTIGSALCGAAPSLGVLIAARCIEAIGAAAIFSVNIAMITASFPESEHGRALGFNAILVALAVSVGPTVGGILTETLGWRWIFYVNLPIGVLVIPLAWRVLTERARRSPRQFDIAGAVLLAIGLVGVNLALSFGQEWGWTSLLFIGTVLVGVLSLAVAAWVELRAPAPLLDPALFRSRVFVFANISFMLAMMALFAVSFLLPFYFEELRGYDTMRTGLSLTPLSLTFAVVAPISGALSDRMGSRWLAPAGLAIACAGLWLLSRLGAETSISYIVLCLVVTGIGQGLFVAPNSRAIMGAARPDEQGVASGVLATARVIGQSLSVAVAGAMFTGAGAAAAGAQLLASDGLSEARRQALEASFLTGLASAFRTCAAFAAVGVIASLTRGAEAPLRRKSERAAGVSG